MSLTQLPPIFIGPLDDLKEESKEKESKEKKRKEKESTSQMRRSRNAVLAAESKVAEGIKRLHALYAPLKGEKKTSPEMKYDKDARGSLIIRPTYDAQGIAIVRLSSDRIPDSIKNQFPDRLKNGITLHFFREGSIPHPGVRYMGEEKIHSLCDAAIRCSAEDLPSRLKKEGEDYFRTVYLKTINHKIDSLRKKWIQDLSKKVDEISKEYKRECQVAEDAKIELPIYYDAVEKLKQDYRKALGRGDSQAINTYNRRLEAYKEQYKESINAKDPKKLLAIYHAKVDALMKTVSSHVMQELYQVYSDQYDEYVTKHSKEDARHKKSFQNYNEDLLKNASNYRSNNMAILTFNEASESFSFDEGSTVSAHRRAIASGCANLSLVFDGNFDAKQETFKVNTSYAKHASLVPIDAVGKYHAFASEKTPEVWLDTCLNAKQVMESFARLQQHGDNSEEPIIINWTYQLLTSNFFNSEKQATSYGYMAKALQLLDGFTFQAQGKPPL